MLADPLAAGQHLDGGAVEPARRAQVEVFHAGRLAHAGPAQPLLQGGVEGSAVLDVDQQGQALGERQGVDLGLPELGLQGIGMPRQERTPCWMWSRPVSRRST